MSLVLVTGGSGFVGNHCLLSLLNAGHGVRTTLRNLEKSGEVRRVLTKAGARDLEKLSFVEADLSQDQGWSEAAQGCEYVLHVASPFPAGEPRDENELIIPARDGALRVLRASRDSGVKRVVMTSSFAAIGYGHAPQAAPFNETSWTNLKSPGLPAYHKSKTIAERAAWDFIAREGGSLELSVVNPVGIFGPVLGSNLCSSVKIIKMMLDGAMPVCPRIYFGTVDVRDVVDLHLRAMTDPKAKGERFLAVAGECVSLYWIARVLKENLGSAAKHAPKAQLPDWSMRLLAAFDKKSRGMLPELGKVKNSTSAKAQKILGWSPRSREEGVLSSAKSLIALQTAP